MKISENSWHWRMQLDKNFQQKALRGNVSITSYITVLTLSLLWYLFICSFLSFLITGMIGAFFSFSIAKNLLLLLILTIISFSVTVLAIYYSYINVEATK